MHESRRETYFNRLLLSLSLQNTFFGYYPSHNITNTAMACGGSCCGTALAGAAPINSESQEQQPSSLSPVITPALSAADSSRSLCDTQNSSGKEDSCCSPNRNKDLQPGACCSQRTTSLSPTRFVPETRVNGCCSKKVSAGPCDGANPRTAIRAIDDTLDTLPSDITTTSPKLGCKANCCTVNKKAEATVNTFELLSDNRSLEDAEKSGTGTEHVVLSVSGMTCTGCETKLQRTLAALPYLSKLRTSLVLARAEFDMDHSAATIEDVIKHLARTTEFKCEQVSMQGSSLDIICVGKSTAIASAKWPHGVIEMQTLDKDTVRVAYDPSAVGARDLIEKGWNDVMQLAPMRSDSSLDAGRKHVWHMGLMTLISACLTIPVLVMAWAPLPNHEIAYSSASLALATIVQVCIAGPFYPKALKALVYSRVIEMDLLIVLSTSAAYIFSVVSFGYLIAGKPLSTGEFFETSTLLVTLIMVGRWVASLARQKVSCTNSLFDKLSLNMRRLPNLSPSGLYNPPPLYLWTKMVKASTSIPDSSSTETSSE